MKRSTLLGIDCLVNLVLGVLLVVYPPDLVEYLGLPLSDSGFYPSILGAVLFGIGIALFIERQTATPTGSGLGLKGAIAINLSGGVVLGAWLVFANLELPGRGFILLWILVLILVGISTAEIFYEFSRNKAAERIEKI